MVYKKQTYAKIQKEYNNLQEENKRKFEQKKEEIYAKIPRIKEIDYALHTKAIELTRKILQKTCSAEDIIEQMHQENIDLSMEKGELLATNNYPVDYLSIKHTCKKCMDTGYVDGAICSCFKQKLIENAYSQSNLTELLKSQCFDNFDFSYYSSSVNPNEGLSPHENIQNIFQHCINFVKNFDSMNQNLLFYGETGLGKTFISSSLAKDLLDNGKTVFYQSSNKIFELLEACKFNRDQNDLKSELVSVIYDVDLLIIDDLGTEFTNSFTNSALFDIINTRLLHNLSTIINTNLNIQELTDLYSDRIVSRIIGNYRLLKFFGDDIRELKLRKC